MLEIACFEITSAETALASVADRIEFCADGYLGGTTPNIDEFRYLRDKFAKPIFVMIRPRGGDFYYSDADFERMKQGIKEFKESGAAGFVFGILKEGNFVDEEKCAELIKLAGNTPCTFHRAIDRTPNLDEAIETIIRLGFKNVLTSGGKSSAMEGKGNLKNLIENYSSKINILVGGGVRSNNIAALKAVTGASFFHSSAILPYEAFANDNEIRRLKANLG